MVGGMFACFHMALVFAIKHFFSFYVSVHFFSISPFLCILFFNLVSISSMEWLTVPVSFFNRGNTEGTNVSKP